MTRDANGLWMSQVARNLSDAAEGFLIGKRYLIHDRDPLFTEQFSVLSRNLAGTAFSLGLLLAGTVGRQCEEGDRVGQRRCFRGSDVVLGRRLFAFFQLVPRWEPSEGGR